LDGREFAVGVSLEMLVNGRKPVILNPGWRSMMHGLLLDAGLLGAVMREDIPTLRELAATQKKGVNEPPFDWSQDIADAFETIITAVEKHGHVVIEAHW